MKKLMALTLAISLLMAGSAWACITTMTDDPLPPNEAVTNLNNILTPVDLACETIPCFAPQAPIEKTPVQIAACMDVDCK